MQFIDLAEVEVVAGKGGDGMVAFRREKYVPAGGPAGGNGGWGGSVILVASNRLQTLLDFRYARIFKAEDGKKVDQTTAREQKETIYISKFPVGR